MSIHTKHSGVRVASLLILFTIFVFTPTLVAQSKDMPITASKDALALYLQGRDKIENLEDPGTLFDQAIQKDPNFAMAYLFAGRTNQAFQSNLEKAVALADKVSPGEKEWILAVKAQSEGDPAGRKTHLDQLMRLHPDDKRAHMQMAFYYFGQGDNAEALKHFSAAAKVDKDYAPAYNMIGYANLNMGKYADAETAFKNYIRLIPKNPNPYDSYAELLMKMGKFDESIAQYNKALAADPAFFNSYRGIGNNYVYKGDYVKAREAYQQMYDKAPDGGGRDQALESMMNSYISEGQIDKAMELGERRRQMAEKDGDTQALVGIVTANGIMLLEAGRTDDAAKQFELADKLREDKSLPAAVRENMRFGKMMAQARLLIARDRFDEARTQLGEMRQYVDMRKNPNQERAYHQVAGILELKQKNYPKALDAFAKADPNDPYVWYYQAVAYEGAGDPKKATELYSKVAEWNQLDATGYSIVRPRAVAKKTAVAKIPK